MFFRSLAFLLLSVSAIAVTPKEEHGSLRAAAPLSEMNTLENIYNQVPFTDDEKVDLFDQMYTMKAIMMTTGVEVAAAQQSFMDLLKKDFGDKADLSTFLQGDIAANLTEEQKTELAQSFAEVETALFDGLASLKVGA